ncbi:MAG: penicillin acylase family protein [Ignavibacteriales bacterium]
MRIIKYALAAFIALLILLSVYLYLIFEKTQPTLEGKIKVPELQSPVRIIRDIYGIPHIYAENIHDLFFSQGYVTAQDRLWQMDLSRRAAKGNLSEIFGETTVETDYFFRVMGIGEIAGKIYNKLDDEAKSELEAYSRGVNYYIKEKEPLESIILRYDIEPWSPLDSISIHLLSALDLATNTDEEMFAMKALKKLGEKMVDELLPNYSESGNTIIPEEIKGSNLDFDVLNGYKIAREKFRLFQNIGESNNWVVDGAKSTTGKPILANDLHLRSQIPSVWYEVHLKAPGINVIGAIFPGSPYVAIGHNERVAWGFTDAMADRADLFIERINPANPHQYWYVSHWEDMRTEDVEIRVKDKSGYKTVKREINHTRHGPVINVSKTDTYEALSMKWSAREVEDETLKGLSILNRSGSVREAKEGGKYGGIYTLNMVYADVDRNVGYQLIGGIPIREKGTSSLEGKFPVPGWSGEYEWNGFISDDELPGVINPPVHFLATANNKIVGDNYPYLISNTWAPPYRYERITSLIEGKEKLSVEDFKRMQADVYSVPARKFVGVITKVQTDNPEVKWVLDKLSAWNYEMRNDSLPALLYETIRTNLIRNTFKDELKELYPDFLGTLSYNCNLIDKIIDDPNSHWWDNVDTPKKESRDEIITRSIEDALGEIKGKLGEERETWTWGAIHKYHFIHPLGRVRFLDKIFNFGPIPAQGDRDTINYSYFSYQNPYDTIVLSSYRFICDLSDINHALGMNSTGQSGDPFSKRYKDMVENWSQVRYHPLLFDDGDIKRNKWKELDLNPM